MSMRIISPGPLSTIQDMGRWGYMQFGFSPSGALDSDAAKIANLLVLNKETEAVIEMTMFGITAEFTNHNVIAITGGDFSPTINGKPVPMYTAIEVSPRDVLVCGLAKTGCRGYIAVSGGFDIPSVMGSKSTNLKCSIGGFLGRKLLAGDVLKLSDPQETVWRIEKRKYNAAPIEKGSVKIRVVCGLQKEYFTDEGIHTFFSNEYTVTPDSDRMGMKLDGPEIKSKTGVDIISDAIPLGGIQIPSSGKPIIMLCDRQTTGGYAKLGTVISADIPKLAQLTPHQKISFVEVSLEEAQRICREQAKKIRKFKMYMKIL